MGLKIGRMWGFSLWDPKAKELILCRDPFGIKPLVRTQLSDGTLLFGSEVKTFRGHPDFTAKPDISALSVRLAYEYPLDQTTLFQGVTSVGIGTIETWSLAEGKATLTGVAKYWKPPFNSKRKLESFDQRLSIAKQPKRFNPRPFNGRCPSWNCPFRWIGFQFDGCVGT